MYKLFLGSICLILLASCNGRSHKESKTNLIADSIHRQKLIDSQRALGSRPDSEEVEPSFEEVKNDLVSRYDTVERIDTTIVVGDDSLHVHEKYYCLKDNAVVVPKKYLWGGDKTKDFITHNFVSDIMVIKNKDTVINKIFTVKDFNSVIFPEERQYAILFNRSFHGYDKLQNGLVFGYSITIPLTDAGRPAYIAISKNGGYKILDEYAKFEN